MSVLEIMLRNAANAKGTWHKGEVLNIRMYIMEMKEDDIRTMIKGIQDQNLLRILWEVGLSQTLQNTVIEHSRRLAEEQAKGGE